MTDRRERATVHYSGLVQGVGFRWRVRETAERHPVTGWVANLRDGRVLLVAEGARSDVEGFLAAVAERLSREIEVVDVEWGPATGELSSFAIRRL